MKKIALIILLTINYSFGFTQLNEFTVLRKEYKELYEKYPQKQNENWFEHLINFNDLFFHPDNKTLTTYFVNSYKGVSIDKKNELIVATTDSIISFFIEKNLKPKTHIDLLEFEPELGVILNYTCDCIQSKSLKDEKLSSKINAFVSQCYTNAVTNDTAIGRKYLQKCRSHNYEELIPISKKISALTMLNCETIFRSSYQSILGTATSSYSTQKQYIEKQIVYDLFKLMNTNDERMLTYFPKYKFFLSLLPKLEKITKSTNHYRPLTQDNSKLIIYYNEGKKPKIIGQLIIHFFDNSFLNKISSIEVLENNEIKNLKKIEAELSSSDDEILPPVEVILPKEKH